MLTRRRKRRHEVAELLQTLVDKHPLERVSVAWDNSRTHQDDDVDDDVEAVVRGAAGQLGLLYLPTYSPWLNPIERLWRQFRREVPHGELFTSIHALLPATRECFDRYNRTPGTVRSIIGALIPQNS